MTNVRVIKNAKKVPRVFSRIFFFYLLLVILFLSSCARIEQPQILSIKVEGLNVIDSAKNLLNREAIQLNLVVEVSNQNNTQIEFMVQNFGITLNNQPIGKLVKPETYVLLPEAVSNLKIGIAVNQGVLVGMLLFGQIEETVTIEVLGDILIHHAIGDYPVQVAEQHEIRLSDLGL